jgi:hypothetical protein
MIWTQNKQRAHKYVICPHIRAELGWGKWCANFVQHNPKGSEMDILNEEILFSMLNKF